MDDLLIWGLSAQLLTGRFTDWETDCFRNIYRLTHLKLIKIQSGETPNEILGDWEFINVEIKIDFEMKALNVSVRQSVRRFIT